MIQGPEAGQAAFNLAGDVQSNPFSAFPASARLPVLVGEPAQEGPCLIKVFPGIGAAYTGMADLARDGRPQTREYDHVTA